jgi:5-methylthioadenosine/S-adenosylhomocysteine deaminase
MKQEIVIRGGRLLDARRRTFAPADVFVVDGRIAEIGPPGLPASENAKLLNATGKLIHPGLINAHTHGHGSLSKGMGDRWTLELLLTSSVWTYAGRTLEDRALSTKLAAAEMALKGCTACYDLNLELPAPTHRGTTAVAQAYADVGIRAVIAPAVADRSFFQAMPGLLEALPVDLRSQASDVHLAEPQSALATLKTISVHWPFDNDKIRLALAPTIPMHCSDDFLTGCSRLADEFGLSIHSHVAESKVQALYARQLYGGTIAAHLDRLGLLGPRFTVAHGVWLTSDDMRLLGNRGVAVAHNPGSNMRIGSGLADVRSLLRHNVTVGIGTDGANCADHQNMYEAMRLASLVSKVQGPNTQEWLSTEEVFDLATQGSAKVLGWGNQIGRVAPGYFADLVFLEADHINWLPLNDAVNQLVHSEDATAVHSVMVAGDLIVEDHRLLTLDMVTLAKEVERARARLESINSDNRKLFDNLAIIVNRFCHGLATKHYPINRFGAWH